MMMAITVAIIVIYIATIIVVIVRAINLNAVIYVTMMVFGHPRRWIIDAAATATSSAAAAAATVTNVIAVKIA